MEEIKYITTKSFEQNLVNHMWDWCPNCRCQNFEVHRTCAQITIKCTGCAFMRIIYPFPEESHP